MSQSWADLYGLHTSGACLPITVDLTDDAFTASPLWVGVAFLLGFLVGVLIAALLVRPCLRSWMKKKEREVQEKEKLGISLHDYNHLRGEGKLGQAQQGGVVVAIVAGQPGRKISGKGRKKGEATTHEVDGNVGEYVRGMSDVLLLTNTDEGTTELLTQDLDAIKYLERTLRDHRNSALLALLTIHLNKQKADGKLTESFCDNIVKKVENDMKKIQKMNELKMDEEVEHLKKDGKYSKNADLFERAKEQIDIRYQHNLDKTLKDHRNEFRQDLLKSSALHENEVDVLMEKLTRNMDNFEDRMSEEQARQSLILEERLLKRQALVQNKQLADARISGDIINSMTAAGDVTSSLVDDGKLNTKKCDDLLKAHRNRLKTCQDNWDTDRERSEKNLSEKLEHRRRIRFQKLHHKQQQEVAQLMHSVVDKSVSTSDFVKNFSIMVGHHYDERETTQQELDELEGRDFDDLKLKLDKSWETVMREEESRFSDDMRNSAIMSQTEAQRVMTRYRQQVDRLEKKREKERKNMQISLMERLYQKRQKLDEENRLCLAEQDSLSSRQTTTIRRALNSNMDLDEDARDMILAEHQRNMQQLDTQLQMSRLKQQKLLERRLNQRRCKLSALRIQQEALTTTPKDQDRLHRDLAQKISSEEEMLERDRENEVSELRKNLATETEQLLQQQEEELGQVIGRLQVGQARRRAILLKQDQTLSQLQDQLEKKVTEDAKLPRNETDQIIQLHYNQVSRLNEHIQRNRETQEKLLREKLETRKIEKERDLQRELHEDERGEYVRQKKQRNASKANTILSKILMEQRHANKLSEIDADMKLEIEKQKEALNQELEKGLQQELQAQRQEFLTQLAALGKLSKSELDHMVDLAAARGDKEERKKLAKKLKMSMKRAKDAIVTDNDDDDNVPSGIDNMAYEVSQHDFDVTDHRPASSRPRSGRAKPRRRRGSQDDNF